jgi:hypothetical protein
MRSSGRSVWSKPPAGLHLAAAFLSAFKIGLHKDGRPKAPRLEQLDARKVLM